jgi:hypothetical protein
MARAAAVIRRCGAQARSRPPHLRASPLRPLNQLHLVTIRIFDKGDDLGRTALQWTGRPGYFGARRRHCRHRGINVLDSDREMSISITDVVLILVPVMREFQDG